MVVQAILATDIILQSSSSRLFEDTHGWTTKKMEVEQILGATLDSRELGKRRIYELVGCGGCTRFSAKRIALVSGYHIIRMIQ